MTEMPEFVYPPPETQRLAEQARLDGFRSPADRNRLGQFATPPALALAIAEHASKLRESRGLHEPVRFLDPSIGTGAFFEALRRAFPDDAIDHASGVELDPAFAEVASQVWGGFGLDVIVGDFARLEPPSPLEERPNLILANPPYVRHHHLGLDAKRRLAEAVSRRVGLKLNGLAGLYAYMLLLADAWLAEGGLALWLVPSEFLDVNYGQVLRDYLANQVTLLHVHRFRPSDVQFGDALVTSAVVAFEKSSPSPSERALMTFGGSLAHPERSEFVSLETLRASRKWSRFPLDDHSLAFDSSPSPPGLTLGDLFTIRRGIATGANAFFILPRAEALARGLPAAYLTPILPSPRHLIEGVIEADLDGAPQLPRPLVLVDTNRPEAELRQVAPALADYLAEGRARGLASGYLTSRRTPWYAQESREPPPFLCTYMARPRPDAPPFRFFWNRSRATAPNVFLLLYPKPMLRRLLDTSPDLHPILFDRLRAIPARHLVEEGRVYGGGLHKIEPKELAALPASEIVDGFFANRHKNIPCQDFGC
jgi:adenine-specific DNA-methyltransferase